MRNLGYFLSVMLFLFLPLTQQASAKNSFDQLLLSKINKKPCSAETPLHCKNHHFCCPAGHPYFCSYHKGLNRKNICGEDTDEIRKQINSQCSSSEICK